MHSNVTSKNVSWLHFSWTTLYVVVTRHMLTYAAIIIYSNSK